MFTLNENNLHNKTATENHLNYLLKSPKEDKQSDTLTERKYRK